MLEATFVARSPYENTFCMKKISFTNLHCNLQEILKALGYSTTETTDAKLGSLELAFGSKLTRVSIQANPEMQFFNPRLPKGVVTPSRIFRCRPKTKKKVT